MKKESNPPPTFKKPPPPPTPPRPLGSARSGLLVSEIRSILKKLDEQHSSHEADYLQTRCQFARGYANGLGEACSMLQKFLFDHFS